MKNRPRIITLIMTGFILALVFTAGTATGAKLITGKDIKDGSVTTKDIKNGTLKKDDVKGNTLTSGKVKDGTLKLTDLDTKANDAIETGGLAGAYYSVAFYNAGVTNAGAIATVACKAQTDTAISGGVQVLGLDAGANSRNTPVSSSFPGRMDFVAVPPAPIPNRLDGWIVQFGGNAGPVPDVNPEKAKVWALCVPGANIPVEQTFIEVP